MLFVALAAALLQTPAVGAPPAPVLTIDGVGAKAVTLDAAAFAELPHATATTTIHDARLTCSGVWLADLAAAAGVATGDLVRGPALATVVVARAADGYRVAFSLGEIERSLGHSSVLVADRCNGAVLPDADGPWRLIVAGDTRGARSVKALERLSIVAVP